MKIRDLKKRIDTDMPNTPLCLILGNFDGVHLGHSKLVEAALEEGKRLGVKVGAWTFAEHPMDMLSDRKNSYLTTSEEKNEIFASMGLDYVIYEDFASVRNYTPTEFVNKILIETLDCRSAVCGFNFKFGKNGKGTPEMLRDMFDEAGRNVVVVDAVCTADGVISSTAVRLAVESGQLEKANKMLGRPYSINFPVVHGKCLGRTIGVPTINQFFPIGRVRPENGIYACSCLVDGKTYMGVANVGFRPTVNDDKGDINCETHIIDYDGWLYGETVKVCFLKKLRDEQRFDGVEELKKAIEIDILSVKEYFSKK